MSQSTSICMRSCFLEYFSYQNAFTTIVDIETTFRGKYAKSILFIQPIGSYLKSRVSKSLLRILYVQHFY